MVNAEKWGAKLEKEHAMQNYFSLTFMCF